MFVAWAHQAEAQLLLGDLTPPEGFAFLVDDSGNYFVTDDTGDYLITEIA